VAVAAVEKRLLVAAVEKRLLVAATAAGGGRWLVAASIEGSGGLQ
jgi:hypothetical protein